MASTPLLTQGSMLYRAKYLQNLTSASAFIPKFYAQTDELRLEVGRIEKLLDI